MPASIRQAVPCRRKTALSAAWTALAALALTACGGGSDGSGTASSPSPASLTLSGTASTGTPIAAAAVDSKCATGTGSATTASTGAYSIAIAGGKLPCMLRVTLADGTSLHAFATTGTDSATANLTPLTELVVARTTGSAPTAAYDAYSGATAPTAAAVQTAVAAVAQTLKDGGVDIGAAGDPMTALIAAGNGYSQALQALGTSLAAGQTSLAALTTSVATAAASSSTPASVTAASLPAAQLLSAPATNCGALRSGRYRFVVEDDSSATQATGLVTIDAAALTVVDAAGERSTLTANGACSYLLPSSGGELVVTAAGVLVGRVVTVSGQPLHGALFFPEQTHTVDELAGDWNSLGFDITTANGSVHLTSGTLSFDAAGKLTALTFCDDLRSCQVFSGTGLPNLSMSANPAGGFDLVNKTDNYTDRLFAYRSGSGELNWVSVSGRLTYAARKSAVTMPAVGRVQDSTSLVLTAQATAPQALSPSRNTVVSVDTVAATYLRNNVVNFTTGATRPETIAIDSPRQGYSRRVPATGVALSDGSGTSNVPEWIALNLRALDLSVLAFPASQQMNVSPRPGT